MRKINLIVLSLAFLSMQAVFADDATNGTDKDKPCLQIVNGCKNAGYTKPMDDKKEFWHNCMKPILMGQSVEGVTIDAATAKSCRENKIEEMKKEIEEFQKVN